VATVSFPMVEVLKTTTFRYENICVAKCQNEKYPEQTPGANYCCPPTQWRRSSLFCYAIVVQLFKDDLAHVHRVASTQSDEEIDSNSVGCRDRDSNNYDLQRLHCNTNANSSGEHSATFKLLLCLQCLLRVQHQTFSHAYTNCTGT